jgi:hypothetical protein
MEKGDYRIFLKSQKVFGEKPRQPLPPPRLFFFLDGGVVWAKAFFLPQGRNK